MNQDTQLRGLFDCAWQQ